MKNLILSVIAGLTVLQACKNMGSEYAKTSSGLEYKMHTKQEGAKAKEGDFVSVNFTWRNDKDSVIQSSSPPPFRVTKPAANGDLMEGFTLLAEGDSATFIVSVDSLFKQNIPPFATKGTFWKFDVRLVQIMNEQQVQEKMQAEQQKQMQAQQQQLEADVKIIEAFLAEQKINATKSPSGLFYIVDKPGKGENAQQGKSVTVHYTGALLDGTKFDSSKDRNEPFTFALGHGQVIHGWDEGITYFNKGAKGRLFIPSPLAYGSRQVSEVIKPNSVLIFEVELVDIK